MLFIVSSVQYTNVPCSIFKQCLLVSRKKNERSFATTFCMCSLIGVRISFKVHTAEFVLFAD